MRKAYSSGERDPGRSADWWQRGVGSQVFVVQEFWCCSFFIADALICLDNLCYYWGNIFALLIAMDLEKTKKIQELL